MQPYQNGRQDNGHEFPFSIPNLDLEENTFDNSPPFGSPSLEGFTGWDLGDSQHDLYSVAQYPGQFNPPPDRYKPQPRVATSSAIEMQSTPSYDPQVIQDNKSVSHIHS